MTQPQQMPPGAAAQQQPGPVSGQVPPHGAPPQPQEGEEGGGGGMLRKGKKRQLGKTGELNINSLMDIMTILLVFLLKSYSADPVEIKQAPNMKLPFSFSKLKPVEATNVTLTKDNILVDDKKVVVLDGGKVNQADMQGDFLIQPLLDALADAVEHQKKVAKYNKKAEFKGICTIIADRDIPFKLLTKIMYTTGQAEFGKYKFAVVKKGV